MYLLIFSYFSECIYLCFKIGYDDKMCLFSIHSLQLGLTLAWVPLHLRHHHPLKKVQKTRIRVRMMRRVVNPLQIKRHPLIRKVRRRVLPRNQVLQIRRTLVHPRRNPAHPKRNPATRRKDRTISPKTGLQRKVRPIPMHRIMLLIIMPIIPSIHILLMEDGTVQVDLLPCLLHRLTIRHHLQLKQMTVVLIPRQDHQ